MLIFWFSLGFHFKFFSAITLSPWFIFQHSAFRLSLWIYIIMLFDLLFYLFLFDGYFFILLFCVFIICWYCNDLLWRRLHCKPSIDLYFYYLVRFVCLLSFTCQFVSRTWCYRFSILDCSSKTLMETALQSFVFEFLGMMEKPFIFDFDYMFWMEMVILLLNCMIHCSTLTSSYIICSYRNSLSLKRQLFHMYERIAYFTKTMKIHFNPEFRQQFLEGNVVQKDHNQHQCRYSFISGSR